jgi:antitoxin component YwqK of YwqJK toxin-antitoxin module
MIAKSVFTQILVLLFFGVSSAQSAKDTLNQRDANNLKQGWWKVYNSDGKFVGYESDQLVEEGEFFNNKKVGVWTKYYPNGNKKHELTFANNIANGYARIYYRSGRIQEEGIWKMNQWAGQYKYYYENGNLKYDWSYNASGKREGEQRYFHENGVIQYLGDWKDGKEAGELREYNDDGSLSSKRYFNEGNLQADRTVNLVRGKEFDENSKKHSGKTQTKLLGRGEIIDGYNKLMNPDGTVSKEGTFKDKKLIDGTVFLYENGKLISSVSYAGGKKVGE